MSEKTALKTDERADGPPVGVIEREEAVPEERETQVADHKTVSNPSTPEKEKREAPSEIKATENPQNKTAVEEVKPEAESPRNMAGPAHKIIAVSDDSKSVSEETQENQAPPAEAQALEPETERPANETAQSEQSKQEVIPQQSSVEAPVDEVVTENTPIDTPASETHLTASASPAWYSIAAGAISVFAIVTAHLASMTIVDS